MTCEGGEHVRINANGYLTVYSETEGDVFIGLRVTTIQRWR
jgi:hypothetical protein